MTRMFLLVLMLLAPAAAAQDLSALERPGAVALMRHAHAPGHGDGGPDGFDIDDCTTQRTLNAAGRAQARRIGAALREAGISFDHVWSSRYCRCRETAELLGLGPVEEVESLDAFSGDRLQNPEKTQAVLALLAALPEGDRALLVGHQVNIAALTTRVTEPGEIVVALRDGDGGLEVIDQVRIAP